MVGAPAFESAAFESAAFESGALQEGLQPAPEFGGQLYVLQTGPVEGPPLVMIHGFGDQGARDFAPLLPVLSQRYRILTFDLPGLARSSRANHAYTPERYVRMISALVARHFQRPVHVLGHSMGGALALQFAADHPEQVDRLMLLDVAGVLHYREYLREVIAGSTADQTVWTRALLGTRKVLFNIGMFPTSRMQLESLALDASPTLRSFFSSSRAVALLFIQHDFGPAIRRVRAPIFLGWGARDTVAPQRTAALLRASWPGAYWRSFANSAHVPMQSEPHEVVSALRSFLEAPIVERIRVPRPRTVGREGNCERLRNRLFEGDYDRIVIHRCANVMLRNVRARELLVDRSEVQLENVELESLETAAMFRRSRVRWTGGELRGAACIETDASTLNLAGVHCSYRSESIRVRQPTRLLASASVLSAGERELSLHGEYELFRTREGALPELRPQRSGRYADHSRTLESRDARAGDWLEGEDLRETELRDVDLREAQLERAQLEGADLRGAQLGGTRLVGANLRGADLRGALLSSSDLRDADLSGADLRETRLADTRLEGARFDARTRFPDAFDPLARGMRFVASEVETAVTP